MSKEDEQVWVFPACMLEEGNIGNGVTCLVKDWTYFVKEVLNTCRFMRRGDVEDEPTLQQVIPYVVCRNGKQILLYNRGVKGGEKRLADKWSIGVGGHINPVDDHSGSATPSEILYNAAARELIEELMSGKITVTPKLNHYGLLTTDITPVDEVHFGVVFMAEFPSVVTLVSTKEIERHKWVSLEELKEYRLETWSEMLRDELLKEEKDV